MVKVRDKKKATAAKPLPKKSNPKKPAPTKRPAPKRDPLPRPKPKPDTAPLPPLPAPVVEGPTAEPILAPAVRSPDNLEMVTHPSGRCPVGFDDRGGVTRYSVLRWAEDLRDQQEQLGKFVTGEGLVVYAMSAIGRVGADYVRDIYRAEFGPAPTSSYFNLGNLRAGATFVFRSTREPVYELIDINSSECKIRALTGETAGTVKPCAPAAEVCPGNRAGLLLLAGHRPTATGAVKDRPRGDTTPENRVLRKPPRQPRERKPGDYDPANRLQSAPATIPNRTKIPVEWTGANGKHKARVYDHPIRPLARWMGRDGWTNQECKAVFVKLGLGDYPDIDNHVIAAHAGAGRKGSEVYGPVPNVTDAQANALRALKE